MSVAATPPPTAVIPRDFATGSELRLLTLLPGVIGGVTTQAVYLPAGSERAILPLAHERSLVFVVSGAGSVRAGLAGNAGHAGHAAHAEEGAAARFGALALLILPVAKPAWVRAETGLVLFEIVYGQTAGEIAGAVAAGDSLAVIPYAECATYREAIKSPQTKNRTLVKPGQVPRFAMGSVETSGPDAVAPHAHLMLEQLFFGLPSNDCQVTADGKSAGFGAGTLLYIPCGSLHGATVAAGRELHYLWLDFFPTAADMRWITEQHIDNPPPGGTTN